MTQRLRIIFLLLGPSWVEFFLLCCLSGALLTIATWSTLTNSPLFYDYFFGPQGAFLILQSTPGSWKAMWGAFMSMPLAHNIIVLIASAAIGLIVYALLQSFNRSVSGSAMAWLDIHTSKNAGEKRYIEREFGLRIAFRIILAIVWIWYWLVTLKVIIPFSVLTAEDASRQVPALEGWSFYLLAFGTLMLALHLHVILLRIWAHRLRVFGANK